MHPTLERIVNWLRAGYPQGIPSGDYVPLVAILNRRLSDEEVENLGEALAAKDMLPADHVDIGQGYLKITDELATPDEIDRVASRLEAAGWDIDDEFPDSSTV